MLTFYLALFITACSAAPSSRIVNGTNAGENEWPWQLSLQYNGGSGSSFSHICGASLIKNKYALTAAHCVSFDNTPSNFRVVAGEHDLKLESGFEQIIGIEKVIMHPNYDESAGGFPNDIAILQLSSLASLDGKVNIVKLPSNTTTSFYDGGTCYITGWGKLNGDSDHLSDILQEAPTTVLSHSACVSELGFTGWLYLKQGPHICVYNNYNGACNGDSGGPLVCRIDGNWELAGATSWGLVGCPTSSPSVYARVSNYLPWINNNTPIQ